MRRAAGTVAIACACLASCGITPLPDKRQALIETWGAWLLERYATTATAADALGAKLDALCAAPDATTLEAARTAWQAARTPWKEAEVMGFGPYTEEPLRYGPDVDFWPARPDAIEKVVAATAPITPAGLASTQRGFGAIEYFLWSPEGDPVAALAGEPRRCDYLKVLGTALAADVRALAQSWDHQGGDFLGELTDAGERETQYDSLQLAFGEVVNRVGYLVENVRNAKLAKPLGIVSGGGPQPDATESRFADRGVDDIRDNLAGVRRLLLGDGAADLGLDGYLRGRGRHLKPLVTARLDAVEQALDALEQPLDEAVVDEGDAVQALIDRLGELQRTVQVDVIGALSLTIGFNDADGD